MKRLLAPFEYRHLCAFGFSRIAGGTVAAVAGIICLSYEAYPWAAFFLVVGTLSLAVGYWELAVAPRRG